MTSEELKKAKRRQPFRAFRVAMASREAYEIRHAELVMFGLHSILIGIADYPGGSDYDRTVSIDLGDIVAIQELPVHPPSANGPAS
jgi:hypothetical protein